MYVPDGLYRREEALQLVKCQCFTEANESFSALIGDILRVADTGVPTPQRLMVEFYHGRAICRFELDLLVEALGDVHEALRWEKPARILSLPPEIPLIRDATIRRLLEQLPYWRPRIPELIKKLHSFGDDSFQQKEFVHALLCYRDVLILSGVVRECQIMNKQTTARLLLGYSECCLEIAKTDMDVLNQMFAKLCGDHCQKALGLIESEQNEDECRALCAKAYDLKSRAFHNQGYIKKAIEMAEEANSIFSSETREKQIRILKRMQGEIEAKERRESPKYDPDWIAGLVPASSGRVEKFAYTKKSTKSNKTTTTHDRRNRQATTASNIMAATETGRRFPETIASIEMDLGQPMTEEDLADLRRLFYEKTRKQFPSRVPEQSTGATQNEKAACTPTTAVVEYEPLEESMIHVAPPVFPDEEEEKNTLDQEVMETDFNDALYEDPFSESFENDDFGDHGNLYDFHSKFMLEKKLREDPSKYKLCTLYIETNQKAHAIPIGTNEQIPRIELYGRIRSGLAFNESIVVVEVFNPPENDPIPSHTYRGKVIGVWLEPRVKKFSRFACTIDDYRSNLAKPICRTAPKIELLGFPDNVREKDEADVPIYSVEYDGQLKYKKKMKIEAKYKDDIILLVRYLKWKPFRVFPLGVAVGVLKGSASLEREMRLLMIQHDLVKTFPTHVADRVKALSKKHKKIPVHEFKKRLDYRGVVTLTIDPADTRDIDDALSVEDIGDYRTRIGVHIADVTHFVKKDDFIDKEARARGVSFYPPSDQPRIFMLPDELTTSMCSLVEGEDRLALSVFFDFDQNGNMLSEPTIKRTVVKSKQKLSYEEAEMILCGTGLENEISNALKQLHHIASKCRAQRLKEGSAFNQFQDNGAPMAHVTVEEFMILANVTIGRSLGESFQHVLLRVQDPPMDLALQMWQKEFNQVAKHSAALKKYRLKYGANAPSGLKQVQQQGQLGTLYVREAVWKKALEVSRKGAGQELLDIFSREHHVPLIYSAHWKINELQRPARMAACSSTAIPSQDKGHHGLNMTDYTWFTSPIRRYVDIVVHRFVHAMLDKSVDTPPYSQKELEDICKEMNALHRKAKKFHGACELIQFCLQLKENKTSTILPVVTALDDSFIQLCLPCCKDIPSRHLRLRFGSMGLNQRPSLDKGTGAVFQFCPLRWKKRLYDRVAVPKPPGGKRQKQRAQDWHDVNPNQFLTPMPVGVWDGIIEAVSQQNAQALSTLIKMKHKTIANMAQRENELFSANINTDAYRKSDGTIANKESKFQLKVTLGTVVRVLAQAKFHRGSLCPRLSLMSLSPNVHICLKHHDDPVACFCDISPVKPLDETYTDEKTYQSTLIPLLQIEGAQAAVIDEVSLTVSNVRVSWMKKNANWYGSVVLGDTFCEDRGIRLSSSQEDDGDAAANPDRIVDTGEYRGYVCIVYRNLPPDSQCVSDSGATGDCPIDHQSTHSEPSSRSICLPQYNSDAESTWLGHGLIVHVRRRDKRVVFKLLDGIIPETIESKSNPKLATVEFLDRIMPSIRMENAVRSLGEATILARNIALGKADLRDVINDRDWKDVEAFFYLHEEDPKKRMERERKKRREPSRVKPEDLLDRRTRYSKGRYLENYLPRANKRQREAVISAIMKPFSLIQGPPGTGKTLTGIRLAYLFVEWNRRNSPEERKHVLYCGPSNKSVDVVADFFKKKFTPQQYDPNDERPSICPKILRVYGKSLVNRDFPIPKEPDLLRGKDAVSTERHKDIALHHLIRSKGTKISKDILELDAKFKSYFKDPVKNDVSLEIINHYKRLVAQAEEDEIKQHDVILCTCTTAGSKAVLRSGIIEQSIVDESGMCVEPDCLVPIVHSKAKQIVLIGDHKQLRPIVLNQLARDMGLERSLFERYATQFPKQTIMLNKQYRMHPDICDFPSSEFYDGQLYSPPVLRFASDPMFRDFTPAAEVLWPRIRQGPMLIEDKRFVMCHVEGEEESLVISTPEGGEMSKKNKAEIQEVERIYSILVSKTSLNLSKANIMVLSQYRAQVNGIEKALKERHGEGVQVSTVVASQGGEWDIVIFSTVRSIPEYQIVQRPTKGWCKVNLGFITDDHQINVALTRPRRFLIIIGNKQLLKCDPTFKKLIAHYEENGRVKDAGEFLPRGIKGTPFYKKLPPRLQRKLDAGEYYQEERQRSDDGDNEVKFEDEEGL
ncbi:helicase with zinc finger domain 2 [Lingula anatina]|uniref:Helicase with zinc finger domain 2 n=1 Tax=Lingula anatina TaxID=7574 RepID=A0A2R2MRF9_LINAN|nr:helicase with zinc finger domain 2 [Lingula anatina]|eukprot:XP_023932839.1 helicase with zinc finger domain 2 [Lingula anatina]